MSRADSYSARSATPLGPIRVALLQTALRVMADTAADLRLEARMKAQIDPQAEDIAALNEQADQLELAADCLRTAAPKETR